MQVQCPNQTLIKHFTSIEHRYSLSPILILTNIGFFVTFFVKNTNLLHQHNTFSTSEIAIITIRYKFSGYGGLFFANTFSSDGFAMVWGVCYGFIFFIFKEPLVKKGYALIYTYL
jgi:hypothetical protein